MTGHNNSGKTGGNDWIRQLISEHEGKLIIYASRLLGDIHRARDVVQDTFLKLCKQERDKVEGHEAQWLFTVCRNRCFEVRRKEKRMIPVDEVRIEIIHSRTAHPAEMIEQEDDLSLIRTAVNTLPERQQEIVRLKFQNGLSYREISRITEMTVSNVGVTLHNAITTLRKQINQEPAAQQVEG